MDVDDKWVLKAWEVCGKVPEASFLVFVSCHRKIFVGGLSWETTAEGLKEYFGQFGEVTDSVIMMDPMTKRPR